MSFSYTPNALNLPLNRIRLELGDTDEDYPLLQDEEIEWIISEISGFKKRVAKCCRLICSKLAKEPDKISFSGSYSEDQESVYDRFLTMAKRFEAEVSSGPWAGSISPSFKRATEDKWGEGTLVEPKFKRGMHDDKKAQ